MTTSDRTATANTTSSQYPLATADAESAVGNWLHGYVAQPHELIGRDGAVCPFVEPALHGGTLLTRFHTGLTDVDAERMHALVHQLVGWFRAAEWPHSNPTMRTLVLVLPDLPEFRWHLLDDTQAELKAELAHQGLMLGQFHPACPDRAARNPDFPVSRSPVPLLAIRNMALHDVLFLHDEAGLFAEYRHRFGARYTRNAAVDPLFRELYDAALARHVAVPPG